jgi:hypothetical protein
MTECLQQSAAASIIAFYQDAHGVNITRHSRNTFVFVIADISQSLRVTDNLLIASA